MRDSSRRGRARRGGDSPAWQSPLTLAVCRYVSGDGLRRFGRISNIQKFLPSCCFVNTVTFVSRHKNGSCWGTHCIRHSGLSCTSPPWPQPRRAEESDGAGSDPHPCPAGTQAPKRPHKSGHLELPGHLEGDQWEKGLRGHLWPSAALREPSWGTRLLRAPPWGSRRPVAETCVLSACPMGTPAGHPEPGAVPSTPCLCRPCAWAPRPADTWQSGARHGQDFLPLGFQPRHGHLVAQSSAPLAFKRHLSLRGHMAVPGSDPLTGRWTCSRPPGPWPPAVRQGPGPARPSHCPGCCPATLRAP